MTASAPLTKAREYEEKYGAFISQENRPSFHLTPRIGWMNDPNGFSFYNGKYHLFYQYHPYSSQWGPMHWGHAVSEDLLHWTYLPAALSPDTPADSSGCFSGSACTLPDRRHLLLYTGVQSRLEPDGTKKHFQTQCLAFGDGMNYEKYDLNPVIGEDKIPEGFSAHDFRDPRIYLTEKGTYECVVGARAADKSGAILLYESPDALKWHFKSVIDQSYNEYGKMWECPDFFALDSTQVLLVSPQDMTKTGLEFHSGNGTLCLLGSYDARTGAFEREHVQAIDYGIDFYAPQTLLTEDGRRVMIGWMQNWDTCCPHPGGEKWFGQTSLPRELSVRDGRLIQTPVRELAALHGRRIAYENVPVRAETSLNGIFGRCLDLTVSVRPESPDSYDLFRIKFAKGSQHYSSVSYRPSSSTVRISREHSGFNRDFVHERKCFAKNQNGEIKFRIILDRYSAEIFVNDGEQVLTMTFYTPLTADGISFEAQGKAVIQVEKYEILA